MTEICENNKMHYFYRETDFRKTEQPSLVLSMMVDFQFNYFGGEEGIEESEEFTDD